MASYPLRHDTVDPVYARETLLHGVREQAETTEGLVTAASVAENPSGISPTEFNLVVLPEEVKQVTAGGIHLPDEHRDRLQGASIRATVVAVSPLAFTYNDAAGSPPRSGLYGVMPIPAPGQTVLLAKYGGLEVEGRDRLKYRIVKDKDVLALLENDHA